MWSLRLVLATLAVSLPLQPGAQAFESLAVDMWECPGPDGTVLYTNKERPECQPKVLQALSVVPSPPDLPLPSSGGSSPSRQSPEHKTSPMTRPSEQYGTFPRSPIRHVTGTRPMLGAGRCTLKSAACTQNGFISIKTRAGAPIRNGSVLRRKPYHPKLVCSQLLVFRQCTLSRVVADLRRGFHSHRLPLAQPFVNCPEQKSLRSPAKPAGPPEGLLTAIWEELRFFRNLGNHHVALSVALRGRRSFGRRPAVTIHR